MVPDLNNKFANFYTLLHSGKVLEWLLLLFVYFVYFILSFKEIVPLFHWASYLKKFCFGRDVKNQIAYCQQYERTQSLCHLGQMRPHQVRWDPVL